MRLPILLLLAGAFAAPPAGAQGTSQPEKEAAAPSAAQSERTRALQASEASADGAVTYEQVMADPDNVELNFAFARAQIRDGDVKGASATLERIVMLRPNMAKARLLFAVVLYRLDDVSSAERELLTLTEGPWPADVKAEAEGYLRAIRGRQRKNHFNASLSLGGGFDTNRNASPASGKALFSGAPLQLSGANERRDDFSYPFVASIGASRELSNGHSVNSSFSMYQSEQILTKNLNLKAYTLRAGGVARSPLADVAPTLQLDHVQLAQSTFLRSLGGDLNFSQKLTTRSDRFFRIGYAYQDYVPTRQIATANQRSGNLWEFGGGYGFWVRPQHRLAPGYAYSIKNAASSFNAYTRHAFSIDHTWLLGKGMFLLSGLTAGYDRYVAQDDFVSPLVREDDNYRVRSIIGAPLSLLYAPLRDLLGTVSYEYYHSLSNLPNYSYTNNKLSAMLIYSWGI